MKKFLQQQIFPGIYANYSNKIISEIYKNQENAEIDISDIKEKKNEYISKLKIELEQQIERKIKLEDKAKSLLFIIALAITIMTFSLSFIKENLNHIIPVIFIILSITHFVISGIRALQTLNIKQFNIHQTTIKYQENKFIIQKEKKASLLLKELIKSKSLNDLINTKISNLTYASFILIRNGLIFFVLFFITTISISLTENKAENVHQTKVVTESKLEIKDTINIKKTVFDEIKQGEKK